ncbi:MAG: CDGSH iron-sulfur domain-containing protein [Sphingomonadales bacterium]
MDLPKVAKTSHYLTEVKPDRIYWWCACGLSEKQPFCDGSHKGTGLAPVKFQTGVADKVYFCGCKASKNAPLCDGTHKELKQEKLEINQ